MRVLQAMILSSVLMDHGTPFQKNRLAIIRQKILRMEKSLRTFLVKVVNHSICTRYDNAISCIKLDHTLYSINYIIWYIKILHTHTLTHIHTPSRNYMYPPVHSREERLTLLTGNDQGHPR